MVYFYFYWYWSKVMINTEATARMGGKLLEVICIGYLSKSFLMQQQQQRGGLPTTPSYLGGVQVEDDVDNNKMMTKMPNLR